MPTISDISESESSHHMVPQPGVTPRRSIFDEEQNRFVEMAPAADDGDDDGHDDDTVYGDTSDVPESEPARQRRRTDDFDHYANACPDPTLSVSVQASTDTCASGCLLSNSSPLESSATYGIPRREMNRFRFFQT